MSAAIKECLREEQVSDSQENGLHIIYFNGVGIVCLKTSLAERSEAQEYFKNVGGHPMDVYGYRTAKECPVCCKRTRAHSQ